MIKPSRYLNGPSQFYETARPIKIDNPKTVIYNERLAQELGIDTQSNLIENLAGQNLSHPSIALAYAGHQFGHFVPQLGDGRAHLLGEIESPHGISYDLQLKGSGRTPYSRRGDGMSPLGPALREFLISEAMHYLGIQTTRSLSVIETHETVYRETEQPGAIVSRVSKAHIRVGSFEYFAAREDKDSLRALYELTRERLYPDASNWVEMFKQILKAQAELMASWLSVGFIHGVMNTDNMSLAGETIDFGPCAFMDHYRGKEVFSSIDRYGRYAFKNQPEIAHWNLSVLAGCFALISDSEQLKDLQDILNSWDAEFEKAYKKALAPKFGVEDFNQLDLQWVQDWYRYLEINSLDFTLAHRNLALLVKNDHHEFFPENNTFSELIQKWKNQLAREGRPTEIVELEMNTTNPFIIPRNHLVEKALKLAEAGELELYNRLWESLKSPYQFEKDSPSEEFINPPKDSEKIEATFCGT